MAMRAPEYASLFLTRAGLRRPRSPEELVVRDLARAIEGLERDLSHGELVFRDEDDVGTFARYLTRNLRESLSIRLADHFENELGRVLGRYGGGAVEPGPDEARAKAKVLERGLGELAKVDRSAGTPLLFFLGAGASKPEPSNIPLVDELLPALWDRSNQLETRPLESLQKWCEASEIANIEEMLTGVYIANVLIGRPKVHALLRSVLYPGLAEMGARDIRDVDAVLQFRNTLNTFFSLLIGTMLHAEPNPTHEAVATFVKEVPNASILTTNYDACVDLALDSAGVPYHYVIREAPGDTATRLIKMHGSINWFYCENCQGLQMPTVHHMRESTQKGMPYPVTGMCPRCDATTQQFIVPPTAFKYLAYPPIVQVWDEGRQAFEEARMYVVVGYSFSDADDYLAKMLLKALGDDPEKHVVIVDTDEETIKRFRGYITRHVPSFDEKRIHAFEGSGADLVPKVVKTLLGAWTHAAKPKKRAARKKAPAAAASSDGSQAR